MTDPIHFDLDAVRRRLIECGELATGDPLEAKLVSGGRSNLTYTLHSGGRELVLRRPPLGGVLATAHDMNREVRVISGLAGSDIPVPRLILRPDDSDEVSYYVMTKVEGTMLRTDEDFASVALEDRVPISMRHIDVLASLHIVDPEAVGLSDFGRPDGFAGRQVRRWRKQLDSVRGRDIPDLDTLGDRLASRIPNETYNTLVHGDFRFDNMLVTFEPKPEITGVLDWEMSTYGDPFTDLGFVHLFWEGWRDITGPIAGTPTRHDGYPPFSDLLEAYVAKTGFDVSHLDWYNAFGFYKLAVINEGIYARYMSGKTVGEGFEGIGEMVAPLAARALQDF